MINEDIKFGALAGFTIIFLVALLLWAGGLPGNRTRFYNNDTIVCRDQNTKWSLRYTDHQCWKTVEIPLEGHIGEVK